MAAHYDLNITKGSSFTVRLVTQDTNGSVIDLTNWNVRGYAKIKYSEANLLVDLNPQKVSPNSNGFIIWWGLLLSSRSKRFIVEGPPMSADSHCQHARRC